MIKHKIFQFKIKHLITIVSVFAMYLILGTIIPYLFPITVNDNKKQELDTVEYTANNEATGPDRACIIESPENAFNARVEMIRNTENTLDITTYKLTDDASTAAFLGEILTAADKGVSVRIVFNSFINISENVKGYVKSLNSHPNIECRLYNPFNPLFPWRSHAVLHDKIIISDNSMLLMGGRNFDERHFAPSGYNKPITYDREVFVWKQGENSPENISAIDQAIDYIDLLWNSKDTVLYKTKEDKDGNVYNFLKECVELYEIKNPQFYHQKTADYQAQTMETHRITLIHNPINTSKKEPWVAYQLFHLMENADDKVLLQTPYATANKKLLSGFERIAEHSEVSIITNSAASSPNYPAFSNYIFQRMKFVNTGANIFEYQSTNSNHAKSMVIDDRLAIVGSFNMDDRSMYIDTETMLVIDSPAVAQQLTEYIDVFFECSLKVGDDNIYIENTSVQKLDVPTSKKVMLTVVYILLRPVQFLL